MKFTKIHKDLFLVLMLVLVFVGVATLTELQEQVALFSQNYEALQLDELPLTLLVLSLGLWWFAWRRTQEAHAQLQERSRSELKVQELLQHNSDLLQRLFTAEEDERLALARELHDEMGQTSTAIRTEVAV
ncbi:MAG: two-component sensor histidine kinase, partial [Betaproteobacteria bacterium]|nr:two-component sensor histidine kinase [Betaproteobacteria bacterium]